MSNKHNIEDLFSSMFDTYTQTPSNNVWNNINKKLIGPRLENIYQNAFKGFKLSPSNQTWRRIAAAVWFNRFIHFSPFSLNIYYIGIIITAVIGTVITVNNNPDLNFIHFSEPFDKANTINPSKINFEQTANNNLEYRNAIPNPYDLKPKSEPKNLTKNPVSTIELNNINSNNNIQTSIISSENNQEINNSSNPVLDNNAIVTTEKEINNSFSENSTNPNYFANNKSNIDKFKNVTNSNFKLNKLLINNIYTLTYQPTPFEIADIIIPEIPKQNIIIYDTIGVDYHGNPILNEKSYFAFDLYFNPFYQTYFTNLINPELSNNFELYKSNIDPQLSYSVGIGFSYSYKNFRIETGIGYQNLHELFNTSVNQYEINSYTEYEYNENEFWEYNTIQILDIDEFIQDNIVYIDYVDSVLTSVIDSSLVCYKDSVLVNKNLYANNNYQFLDIPIVGGYEFKLGQISITPKAGIISSILLNKKGTCYNILTNDISNVATTPISKFLFDYYASINLQYSFGKHTSIYIEPNMRNDINSIFEEPYAITQKNRKFGFKTGIYFKF